MDGPLLSFKIHVVALKVHLLFNWRQIDATVKINLTEKLKRCSQSIFNEGQKSLDGRFLGSFLTTFTVFTFCIHLYVTVKIHLYETA